MKSMTSILKSTPSVAALVFMTFCPVFGQELMKIKHSCNFDGEETSAEHYTFEASNEATKIVNTLLQASGLTTNSFILKESNCKNALATSEGRNRYILYNPVFLQKFKMDTKSKWVGYCVLAHEIAHHLNGHDLETGDPSVRKRQELEADRYAGHWLAKMGANLEEAQAGIQGLPLENETNTHPPKSARMTAVTNGWTKAKETEPVLEKSKDSPPSVKKYKTPPNNNNKTTSTNPVDETTRPKKEMDIPNGSIRCPDCKGYGNILKQKKCDECAASGRAGKRITCANCNGVGKKEVVCTHNNMPNATLCTGCGLTGKRIEQCAICSGKGYMRNMGFLETCDICNGTKILTEEPKCYRCKGKGVIKN